ncbi:rap guanine nucleotide exchange factor 5-like [Sinocyclocheilus rhinocerous]|uniref:rap guanine nucleotide exchange factor 5-like n=1 Tax=Sinocyclocheilus rhinocerous TaxID=307959 RepID=UPI0007B7AD97|nr:PREDICTED: rap guanine nucleotide exchange factor 5-like [Sinocyclocheilus rhinocerous]
MASRVWQVLLELGILHSVDQRLVFEDSNTYYQFSFEECDAQGCEFRNEEEWQNGVRLLLQLVPYVQFRVVSPPEEDPDRKRDICSEILQMKALERLTSTVQNELAAALARKAKKSMSEDESSEASDVSPCSQNSEVIFQGFPDLGVGSLTLKNSFCFNFWAVKICTLQSCL